MTSTNSTPKLRHREVENWATVSFAPTVGWTNHFKAHDGTSITSPCPGIIVQEHRSTTVYQDAMTRAGRPYVRPVTDYEEAPYATRAVAADLEFGALISADDVDGYVDTTIRDDSCPPPREIP